MFAQLGVGSSSEVQGLAVESTAARDSGNEATETPRPGLRPTSSYGSCVLLALMSTHQSMPLMVPDCSGVDESGLAHWHDR